MRTHLYRSKTPFCVGCKEKCAQTVGEGEALTNSCSTVFVTYLRQSQESFIFYNYSYIILYRARFVKNFRALLRRIL